MKKLLVTLIASCVLAGFSIPAFSEMQSLRVTALESKSESFDKRKQVKQKDGFERSYKLQPPMIPHAVDKDEITLKTNTCMKCHSAKNYEKEKAPKVGDSHFKDREGKVLDKLSSRRYFCNQCHATQVDADQLVQNDFVGNK